jgi:16S rRNA (guanine527-N7)-methyltransferase
MSADHPAKILTLANTLATEFPALPEELLARYLRDIVEWNDRAGLVSRRSTLASVERLVRQSIGMYEVLRRGRVVTSEGGQSIADIGSGAGFPGLVWKLIQPSLVVTLIERNQKKATFLERSVVVLALAGVEVIHGDASEVGNYERFHGQLDVVASVAVSGPSEMARLAEPFLRPGGHYCTMRPRDEMAQASRIGRSMALEAVSEREFGRICLYRREPATGYGGSDPTS